MQKKNCRKEMYKSYLNSPEWEEKRQLILKRENGKCQKCRSSHSLQIHHGTYVRLFKEELSDLFCLCSGCHNELHKPYGTKDLFRVTIAFISGEEYIPKAPKQKKIKTREEKIAAHNKRKEWNRKKKEKQSRNIKRPPKVRKRKFLPEVSPKNNYCYKGTVVVKKWKLGDPRTSANPQGEPS